MSVRTVNIIARWHEDYAASDFLSLIVQFANGYSTEAPDFYGDITVRKWATGLRSVALTGPNRTVTETYDYDESVTFTRIPHNTDSTFLFSETNPRSSMDTFGAPNPPTSDTDCYIMMGDASARSYPDFGKHHLRLFFYKLIDPVTVGTYAVNYDDPGTPDTSEDIVSFVEFTAPEWDYSNPSHDYGELYDVWNIVCGIPEGSGTVDLGVTASRDIRGTYTASINDADIDGSWDTNSVVHHVSLTLS